MGNSLIEIPHFVINKIKDWNSNLKECTNTDRRIVTAVLLALATREAIQNKQISDEVKNIINGMYLL